MNTRHTPEVMVGRGSETVLVVEEEDMVRDLARMILESAGYMVLGTSNGRAALAMCANHQGPIDLLLTDLMLADLNGPELANRAARLRPGLKTMFMSSDPEHMVLKKPFTPVGLIERVREALDSVCVS